MVTMFVFGVLANAARHEPEAIAALTRGGRGSRPANARPPPADPGAPALPGSAQGVRRSSQRAAAGRCGARPMTLSVVVAGGGTAGHIEPALAVADAVRRLAPDATITALGTEKRAGDPAGPGPRLPAGADPAGPAAAQAHRDLLRLPGKVRRGGHGDPGDDARARGRRGRRVRRLRRAAGLPRRAAARVPIVIHEANARPAGEQDRRPVRRAGRRRGARLRPAGAEDVGNPVRRRSPGWTAPRCGRGARSSSDWRRRPDAAGLRRLAGRRARSTPRSPPRADLADGRGSRCCTRTGTEEHRRAEPPGAAPQYALRCRTSTGWTSPTPPPTWCCAGPGAMTVAEIAAVGLPAVYVPLPHGNGEQRLNAAAGGRGRRRR